MLVIKITAGLVTHLTGFFGHLCEVTLQEHLEGVVHVYRGEQRLNICLKCHWNREEGLLALCILPPSGSPLAEEVTL